MRNFDCSAKMSEKCDPLTHRFVGEISLSLVAQKIDKIVKLNFGCSSSSKRIFNLGTNLSTPVIPSTNEYFELSSSSTLRDGFQSYEEER